MVSDAAEVSARTWAEAAIDNVAAEVSETFSAEEPEIETEAADVSAMGENAEAEATAKVAAEESGTVSDRGAPVMAKVAEDEPAGLAAAGPDEIASEAADPVLRSTAAPEMERIAPDESAWADPGN
jgi:hypothetical protein